MTVPNAIAPKPENQTKTEHHQNLLRSYHMTWVTLERDGFPPTILRCYISSIKLAIATLDTIEGELKVLLEMATSKLREIEDTDRATENFDRIFERR